MSTWFHDQATPGDRLKISGPRGDCFYAADVDAHETLILAGTGTGIAPLYALLREALNAGHKGQIWLYHGGLSEDRLYLVAELTELANTYHQVHYLPCVLKGSDSSQFRHGNLNELVLSDLTQSQPNRAYLCGDPDLVYDLRKKLFLAGLALQKIQADAFIGTKGR
jgi:NAD(P)H-flavin reductase